MRSLERDRGVWEHLGATDPLWAVCSLPEGHGGRWSPDAFLATGEREVQAVLGFLADRRLAHGRRRALDFGCGVGRLTRPLSMRFEHVVGVDISSSMLDQARKLNADRPNCEFVLNRTPDLAQFADGSFDLVVSLITLQHISNAAVVRSYLRDFVRVLSPQGIAVFQLPARVPRRVRLHPLRLLAPRLHPAVRERWPRLHAWAMALKPLDPGDVSRTVHAADGVIVECIEDHRSGSEAIQSLAYCVKRAADSASGLAEATAANCS